MDTAMKEFFEQSISEARKSKSEDGRIHPCVGVVIVQDGKSVAAAHRGELGSGDHAEYTVLEKKLKDSAIAGCTVFTTLEPCTSRTAPKISCAQRLIDRRVQKVYIGMLDPNPIITGRGLLALRSAGIETDLYPTEYIRQIEELNRDFIKSHSNVDVRPVVDPLLVARYQESSLDDWYVRVNSIYWNRNFQRDISAIFTHLVEVVGALSLLASDKRKGDTGPAGYIPKAVAWWLALCGKAGVMSVEDMLWDKFPAVCPYCHKSPHDPEECTELKRSNSGPQWGALAAIGKDRNKRPKSLGAWQRMFSAIYPAQQTESFGPSFARLSEELGELAEAIRVFSAQPGYFLSEACDVFAWLMHIQNVVELKQGVLKAKRGEAIQEAFCRSYPGFCLECGRPRCACPPILPTTIGRIAHEFPSGQSNLYENGRFMTPDRSGQRFGH
jgi:pyrimidine deaminase RibD-like protein/NTP pyrophosphatase (non-canonical NTP hydrolase)